MNQQQQQQHSNMPYYEQSSNLMNTGAGGYHDGSYQDIQPNRYEKINQFTTINHSSRSFTSNVIQNYKNDGNDIFNLNIKTNDMHLLLLLLSSSSVIQHFNRIFVVKLI